MSPRAATDELVFKIKSDFLKALAHPVRLAIIEHLKAAEASVGAMVKALDVEQFALSKHLAVLRQAGIVVPRQEKVTVYYSIRDPQIFLVLRPIAVILRKRLEESRSLLGRLGRV